MIASIIRSFTDSLSVPKIIGNGPTKTMPPPFTFSFVFVEEKMSRKAARKTIMIPMISSRKPTTPSDVKSGNLFS